MWVYLGIATGLTAYATLPDSARPWALAGAAIVAAYFVGYDAGRNDRPPSESILNAAARAKREAMEG